MNIFCEIETRRATNVFSVRQILLFLKWNLQTGGVPKADIKSKGKNSSTIIKIPNIATSLANRDFFLSKKMWILSHWLSETKARLLTRNDYWVWSHSSMVVLHTMGSSYESNSLCQLRTGYRALGKALKCVLVLLKHCLVLPSLICGGRWESDWQLSRRKPIGGLGMKGGRVKWKSVHVTPSATFIVQQTHQVDARQPYIFRTL